MVYSLEGAWFSTIQKAIAEAFGVTRARAETFGRASIYTGFVV